MQASHDVAAVDLQPGRGRLGEIRTKRGCTEATRTAGFHDLRARSFKVSNPQVMVDPPFEVYQVRSSMLQGPDPCLQIELFESSR